MNTDTQKDKNRAQGAGLFLASTNLELLLFIWNYSWRSVLVALGYLAGLILAGIIGAIFDEEIPTEAGNSSNLVQVFIASMLLGVFLGPFAARLALSRRQHLALWGSLILFNLGSVIIRLYPK